MIIGKFILQIENGYPVRVTITHEGLEIRISHNELSDLKYLVDKAMREAANALKDEKEVYMKETK